MNRPFWSYRRTPESCESIEPLLPLYADGRATPEETRSVEAHLRACADCRAALSWIQATHSALASRPIAVPPADLHSRIAQAIAASSAAPGTLGAPAPFAAARRPVRSFALRPAYAAAASVTVLGFALALSSSLWQPSPHFAVKPAPPLRTASAALPAPPPIKPLPQRTAPRSGSVRVIHSSPAPLVASTGQTPEPGARAVPLTRKAPPIVIPHEAIVPPKAVDSHAQLATSVPAPRPAAAGRVKLIPRSPAAAHSLVASTSHISAEKRLPNVPDAAPPKISDTPLVAKQDAPVTVAPAIVTSDPPLKTASLATRSEDFLGPVNAAAKAMRTVGFGKSDFVKRQAYSGVASAVQSWDSNHVPVLGAIYSGTAEK